MIKKIISTILMLAMLAPSVPSGAAGMFTEDDNSDILVEVKNKDNEVIYAGALGDFEDGRYKNTDFSSIESLAVADFNSGEFFTITPESTVSLAPALQASNSGIYAYGMFLTDNVYTENKLAEGMTYNVYLQNTTSEQVKFASVIAVYSADGKLKNLDMGETVSVNVNASGISGVELDIKRVSETDTVKAMAWNTETLKPYTKSQLVSHTGADMYGDSFEDAFYISDLSRDITGSVSSSDTDYIKFYVPVSGNYLFFMVSPAAVQLYKGNKSPINLIKKGSESVQTYTRTVNKGYYYLKVYGTGDYLIQIYKKLSESEMLDIYEFDREINVYKQKTEKICSAMYDTEPERAESLYNEYMRLVQHDGKLHNLPKAVENLLKSQAQVTSDYVGAYYYPKKAEFEDLKEKYREISERYSYALDSVNTMSMQDEYLTENVCTMTSGADGTAETEFASNDYEDSEDAYGIEPETAVSIEKDEAAAEDTAAEDDERLTPSLEVQEVEKDSVKVHARFPKNGAKGNTIMLVKLTTEDGKTRAETAVRAESLGENDYTISGLQPGGIYIIELLWSNDGGLNYGYPNVVCRRVQTKYADESIEYAEYTSPGGHVIAELEKNDVPSYAPSMNTWLENMDTVYEKLAELTGGVPYNGDPIRIESERSYEYFNAKQPDGQNYWRLIMGKSGKLIKIHQPFYRSHMQRLHDGDWGDTPIHELSHDFDMEQWLFDTEALAFLKLAYVLEKCNGAKVYRVDTAMDGKDYYGKKETYDYDDFLTTYWFESYRETFGKGNYSPAGMASILLRIKNEIGWEPFEKAFGELRQIDKIKVPKSEIGKFNLFLYELGRYSQGKYKTVYDVMTETERDIIGAKLGGKVVMPESAPLPDMPSTETGRTADISVGAGDYQQYEYIPQESGEYTIYTSAYGGTGFDNDTYIEVYTENTETAVPIAENNNYGGSLFSKVTLTLEAKQSYFVKVYNVNESAARLHARLNIEKNIGLRELGLYTPEDITLQDTEHCMLKFTPPETGAYAFKAERTGNGADTYMKLYKTEGKRELLGYGKNAVVHWLKGGQTYYLKFSGFFMRAVKGRVTAEEAQLVEFKKREDSGFIYVNNPEYLSRYEIVDDYEHWGKRTKIFEQRNLSGKYTYYQPNIAWWDGNTNIPIDYPSHDFYTDIDFYNPTDSAVTVNIQNLTYKDHSGVNKNAYNDVEKYYIGNGKSGTVTIAPGNHKLLYADIMGTPYKHTDLGSAYSGWDRALPMFTLFDFEVTGGNITLSALAAYDVNNLRLADNEERMLKNGTVLAGAEVVQERPSETDMKDKYKGTAHNQSAWVDASINVLLDKHATPGSLDINLRDSQYDNVKVKKNRWMTNTSPTFDDNDAVWYALPNSFHSFTYDYEDTGRKYNFDIYHQNLANLNKDGGINESVNKPLPENAKEIIKYDFINETKEKEKEKYESTAISIGEWGVTYHYTVTAGNITNEEKTIALEVNNCDNLVYGIKKQGEKNYTTEIYGHLGNKNEDFKCPKEAIITVPANSAVTFEVVVMAACGNTGTNNRIAVK